MKTEFRVLGAACALAGALLASGVRADLSAYAFGEEASSIAGEAHPAGQDAARYGPVDLETASGGELYQASCANCHGADGTGVPNALLGFEDELPDFTDCDFAVREPDADWVAVAHEGGPVRGFSEMMPAFRGALDAEQLGRIIRFIRTLCTDPDWPPGELNFPRLLVTEKAYPEDEWVVEADLADRGRTTTAAFVYEHRFGPRSQLELILPYGWAREAGGSGDHGRHDGADHYHHGLGDVVLGIKHAVHHNGTSGTILSFGGEIILPTGDSQAGPGTGAGWIEGYTSFGQALSSDGFFQAQAGAKSQVLHDTDEGPVRELFARAAIGRSWSRTPWSRTWSPAIELLAEREIDPDLPTIVDIVPQVQVALNTRQHVLANFGVRIPIAARAGRSPRLLVYVLLDWFDGGFFEGW